jgi:hypothetical protein
MSLLPFLAQTSLYTNNFFKEIFMLAPHWLDAAFQQPMSAAPLTTDEIIANIIGTNNFQNAVVKAQAAYDAQVVIQQQHQHGFFAGPSPAQQARVAFLAALNAPAQL